MTSIRPIDLDLIKHLISPVISNEKNTMIIAILTEKEIKDVAFSLDPLKSPGPNGYPAKFHQYMWDIVGGDIVNIAQKIFKYKFPLGKINRFFIVLIFDAKEKSSFFCK